MGRRGVVGCCCAGLGGVPKCGGVCEADDAWGGVFSLFTKARVVKSEDVEDVRSFGWRFGFSGRLNSGEGDNKSIDAGREFALESGSVKTFSGGFILRRGNTTSESGALITSVIKATISSPVTTVACLLGDPVRDEDCEILCCWDAWVKLSN